MLDCEPITCHDSALLIGCIARVLEFADEERKTDVLLILDGLDVNESRGDQEI